jgi:hypothetical protein
LTLFEQWLNTLTERTLGANLVTQLLAGSDYRHPGRLSQLAGNGGLAGTGRSYQEKCSSCHNVIRCLA